MTDRSRSLFTDDSPAYAYGFEAGMIWQRLESGERTFEVTCRIENREAISRMVMVHGGGVVFTEPFPCDGWITASIGLDPPAKEIRPRLAVVGGTDAG